MDRIIDICGGAPKGTGLQNLRECIIETKWKYDVAPEDKQVVWKRMILNFMERYISVSCFSLYHQIILIPMFELYPYINDIIF